MVPLRLSEPLAGVIHKCDVWLLRVAGSRTGESEPVTRGRDGQWYLAAWNVGKGAEHLFRLDRIATVEPGTRVFGEHKGLPLARYARRNLYFESGAEREVTLRFRGAAARSRASGTARGCARTPTAW